MQINERIPSTVIDTPNSGRVQREKEEHQNKKKRKEREFQGQFVQYIENVGSNDF